MSEANESPTNGPMNGNTPRAGMSGQAVVTHAKGVLVVLLRGMFSLLQALQYEGVLICITQACAEALMEACWSSDPIHSIGLRGKVQRAFEAGCKRVPAMPPAPPQGVTAAEKQMAN